jgi:NAD(P)-dependent dehydrogenase (short-subunit alcohol dehydrogenase family)
VTASNSSAGRVLVVTGASRGIGAEVARLAASRGYSVCVNYASNADMADLVVGEIEAAGGEAFPFRANTTDQAAVATMFDETERRYGAVTDLVNNAGTNGGKYAFADLPVDVIRNLLEVNVLGYFICAQEAVRRMALSRGGKGGRIVNLSSVAAVNGSVGERVHYAASKGAVNSMTIGLAKEVARDGIRVNAVSPGLTHTDMNAPGRIEKLKDNVPIGRGADAIEVARGILWMLSDEASYVLAANLAISGGR